MASARVLRSAKIRDSLGRLDWFGRAALMRTMPEMVPLVTEENGVRADFAPKSISNDG